MAVNKGMVTMVVVIVPMLASVIGVIAFLSTGNHNTVGTFTIKGDQGQNITIPKCPECSVSPGTSFTEIMFAIAEDG